MDVSIPFEIHITVSHLPAGRKIEFIEFCSRQQAKPLLIELSKGECREQPMLSKVLYFDALSGAVAAATDYTRLLELQQFAVSRVKIEVPSACAGSFLQKSNTGFIPYYEWHVKVDYVNTAALYQLCSSFGVHLSLNALKNEPGFRFITLREYGEKEVFEERVIAVSGALQAGGWVLAKQQSEYCLYDSNVLLDNGWLSG
jgi:hypothetical protein